MGVTIVSKDFQNNFKWKGANLTETIVTYIFRLENQKERMC